MLFSVFHYKLYTYEFTQNQILCNCTRREFKFIQKKFKFIWNHVTYSFYVGCNWLYFLLIKNFIWRIFFGVKRIWFPIWAPIKISKERIDNWWDTIWPDPIITYFSRYFHCNSKRKGKQKGWNIRLHNGMLPTLY